jgi:hypothetical protein
MRSSAVEEKTEKTENEAAKEIGMTQYVKENNDHYKGRSLRQRSTARRAGRSGQNGAKNDRGRRAQAVGS